MAQSRRRPHAPPAARLPGLLRAIRIAELLFFPVVCFMLLSLPVPSVTSAGEMVTYAILVAEAFAAVAVFVGLGRKKTWAWLLAMVLAAWVLTGIVRLGRLASLASQPGNTVLVAGAGRVDVHRAARRARLLPRVHPPPARAGLMPRLRAAANLPRLHPFPAAAAVPGSPSPEGDRARPSFAISIHPTR